MNFQDKIQKCVEIQIKDFILSISEKYSIDQDELLVMWTGERPARKQSISKKPTCGYRFKRGKRENTICGKVLKRGKTACSEHEKFLMSSIPGSKYKVHTLSGLVIKDSTTAIGKYVSRSILEMGAQDIEMADGYGFKIGTFQDEVVEATTIDPALNLADALIPLQLS